MRCSSCKQLLDRYAEGTLGTQRMLFVSQHLTACGECAAVLEELKVVDALLTTLHAPPAPAPNFTFAVMAEVRSMPLPSVPRTNVLAAIAAYVAVAWAIIVLWLNLAGIGISGGLALATTALTNAAAAVHAISAGATGVFGNGTPAVTAFVIAVLGLDVAVGIGVALVYYVIRPRLVARLASVPEGS